MSRKRKKMDDNNEANDSTSAPLHAGVKPASTVQSDAPVAEPLIPSVELLNQINAAVTASTLAQTPLMEAFKLLDGIIASVDWASANVSRNVFAEYISSNPDFFSTLVNLWGFSWEQNFLLLATHIPNTLRRLLTSLSRSSSFNQALSTLAHLILDQQLKTIYRTLSSDRYGPTVAAMNLLSQLASVRRASAADVLYRVVVSGFNAWPKLLSKKGTMREKEILQASKRRKSEESGSIRSSAIRFLLAILKHGSTATKESLLENRLLLGPVVKFLPLDSNETVMEILLCIDSDVLRDKKISRSKRMTLLTSGHLLSRLVILQVERRDENVDPGFKESIRRFLLDSCTKTEDGLCFEDRGWYPRTNADANHDNQVYNIALLRFITQLRPLEDDFQRLLLLRILEKCPELRAPYFTETKSSVEPSLTLSFICTVAIWRDIINLHLPQNLSDPLYLPDQPPPSITVLSNIMPPSITKSYLVKGLKGNSTLVRYAICQLVLIILSKLKDLRQVYRSAREGWLSRYDSILENISRRLPDSSILLALLSNNPEQRLLGNCALKVLELYTELLSPIALNQRIDNRAVSAAFQGERDFSMPLDVVDLLHSVRLIQASGEINWWTRSGSGRPVFTILLQRMALTTKGFVKHELQNALERLMEQSGVFQTITVIRPISQMCEVLEELNRLENGLDIVLDFIEESFSRFMKTPYVYADEAMALDSKATQAKTFSLVLVALARQWLYTLRKEQNLKRLELTTKFFFQFILRSVQIGESANALIALIGHMHDSAGTHMQSEIFQIRNEMLAWIPGMGRSIEASWVSSASGQPTSFARPYTDDFLAYVHEIQQSEGHRLERVRTSHIVFLFRWYANLLNKFDPENNHDGDAVSYFDVLIDFLTDFKLHDPQGMQEVKLALSQAFSQLLPYMNNNRAIFHEDFCRLLDGFYDKDDAAILTVVLKDITRSLSDQSILPISHLPSIISRLIKFWSLPELYSVALILLERFSTESTRSANASFMVSCLESLLSSTRTSWPELSKEHIKLLFRLGYEMQSSLLDDILQSWLQQGTDRGDYLMQLLLSSDYLWKSNSFTIFEAGIINHVGCLSDQLQDLMAQKFSCCNTDLASLEAVLLFATKYQETTATPVQARFGDTIQRYLKRCGPVIERMIIEHDHSNHLWLVLPNMLRIFKDVDLGKWLGLICKSDVESLVPDCIESINAIFKRDAQIFHRELSGWITRTMSRFTRRFAEDSQLSESTLSAVNSFYSLLDSAGRKDGLRSLLESKARYLEPFILAAISNHIESLAVARLLSTLLSNLHIPWKLNSTHLLQILLGLSLRWEQNDDSNISLFHLRLYIATIIQKLYQIDCVKNSNESVLSGVLELYTGSKDPADSILFDVINSIETKCSLNVTSTSNLWKAFRKGWSFRYPDAISSSIETPSALIIREYMVYNTLNFDCRAESGHIENDQTHTWSVEKNKSSLKSGDPRFWLPLVAYCLQRVSHSADLTVLIENYAIGYTIACLSSESDTTRKMACFILLSWARLCGVHGLRERNQINVLVNYIRNTDYHLVDTEYPRIPKFLTVFLSEALQVLMDPQHILYEKVNVFFLQRPSLDLNDIPMAYALSNTGEYFEKEVGWLLDLLIAGLDDQQSVSVYKRRHLLEFFLGLNRARTGKYKTGRSHIPKKIQAFLSKLFEVGHLTQSLNSEHGFGAWVRQELAFGDLPSNEGGEHLTQIWQEHLL